jgi:hypothetical protein
MRGVGRARRGRCRSETLRALLAGDRRAVGELELTPDIGLPAPCKRAAVYKGNLRSSKSEGNDPRRPGIASASHWGPQFRRREGWTWRLALGSPLGFGVVPRQALEVDPLCIRLGRFLLHGDAHLPPAPANLIREAGGHKTRPTRAPAIEAIARQRRKHALPTRSPTAECSERGFSPAGSGPRERSGGPRGP